MKKMTLIATGDAFITRRFPEDGYEGFEQVRDVIIFESGDDIPQ